jgi:NAD(P)-dependent dehydrogenase (short-subunit alcohol dehydrogenase family)
VPRRLSALTAASPTFAAYGWSIGFRRMRPPRRLSMRRDRLPAPRRGPEYQVTGRGRPAADGNAESSSDPEHAMSAARKSNVAGKSKAPAPPAPADLLAGKAAIVTGAGSGLGRGIAEGLARAAARVALLDIDQTALGETCAAIAKAAGPRPCITVKADVTDEAQVTDAFRQAVTAFGGLDICVAAAGIAPAFPLTDFPVGAWRKALDINLTGYFLAGREAARVMTRQGRGGSIILVSSKSGLEASKANSAYNATKAGEIHLARGWALELGRAGIRVNAIAPGNVFKGSRIWNAEYIKTVAKKRGLRPSEVIPYYIGLTALGIDIQPEDVANVVVWLASDYARTITGQVIVCDAGQVFVR